MCIKNSRYIAVLVFCFLLSVFSYTESLTNRIIVIDPGHGTKNSGGKIVNYGCKSSHGTKEMDVVVDISELLGTEFQKKGATVYFTRTKKDFWRIAESQEDDNKQRAEFANEKEADVFLRVHCNWAPNKKKRGALVLWYKKDSEKMAETVYKEIKKSGIKVDGIRKQHLVGFEFANVPAILVEYGYLSNSRDEKLLKDKEYIKKISRAIVKGFEKHFLIRNNKSNISEKE
ncbi:MAG: N-acetylmuramoyl-L-alanine amidase [Elusimicrobia bacterium]|nr:N-acetylmuramoyl-L-alanine amidase [Elusimicrobiota bacterium]